MNDTSQQPLSGQQIQAMANDYAAKLAAIKRDIDLRKFAVMQTVEVAKGSTITASAFEAIMRSVHAFLINEGEKE
jgi:hypothetical protein